jgi:hypothetical protein
MGGSSEAKSTTNILGRAITNILIQSSQNCSASTANIQNITLKNIKTVNCDFVVRGIEQEIDSKINLTCAQDISQNTALKNQLGQEINNQIEAITKGITSNSSSSEAINNVKNEILTSIDMNTFSRCAIQAINRQNATVEKLEFDCTIRGNVTIENIRQLIVSNNVLNCIQSNTQLNTLSNKLDTIVANEVSATSSGLGLNWGIAITILIIVCVVSSLMSVYFAMPSQSSQPQLLPSMQRPMVQPMVQPIPQRQGLTFQDLKLAQDFFNRMKPAQAPVPTEF